MDREAGAQVAIHDTFAYGSHPFYQHQLAPGNGYGSIFGSKPAVLSARFNTNIEESSSEDHQENTQWKGFSSYQMQNGPHAAKPVHFLDAGRAHLTRASDLRHGMADGMAGTDLCMTEQRRKQSLFNNSNPAHQVGMARRNSSFEQDPGSLALKLSFPGADDAINGTRNPKRFRPSSPGNQSPVCQVDDCHKDLKHEKDYHRRHKVCESHSKAPQSLVQKVLQRFCQQCSRFHPLPEFDEGKRSCRRRLAGHNKRRRKTDAATNGASLSEVVKGTDLLSIVALLSQLQAAKAKEKPDVPSTDYESIVQCLRKAAPSLSLPTAISVGAPQIHQAFRGPPQLSQEPQTGFPSPLTDLSKDALVLFLRNILQAQAATAQGRTQSQKMPSPPVPNDQNIQALYSHATNSPEDHSRNVPVDSLVFAVAGQSSKSSGESDPAELCSRRDITKQYPGRTDSCSLEEEDPGSSPNSTVTPPKSMEMRPLEEQKFFPTECGEGFRTIAAAVDDRAARSSEVDLQEEDLNLSPYSAPGHDKRSQPPSDNSDYGSDQSPASSSSTGLVSNGRIIFKLCDPECVAAMTRSHESEIEQWLSLRPGSLEGYLRPGCILLTIFLSMPHRAWEELVANLRSSLKRLVRLSQSDLWTKGRIIVQVGHQRALIVNGKVKKVRFTGTVKAPLLRSVRPLAVVAGEQATLSVCGYNLVPETRIVCVYGGRYVLHEVTSSDSKASAVDSSSSFSRNHKEVQEICFPGGPANVLGRCFIEVERDFMGNSLPVIVANKEICSELQSLEVDLDVDLWRESEENGDSSDESHMSKEMEAMNFLHELGWIFQRTSEWSSANANVDEDLLPPVGLSRFKGVLKYAILRDWCAIVKKLLDLLFFIGIKDNAEVQQVLSEVNLIHQAVKRKCKPMVDLLLHYQPDGDGSKINNIFTPVAEGPGGFTPLHVAASLIDAEEIIDALTDDPNEAGLHGWKSACDHLGRTPEWHARNSGKLSYIQLVERKLLRKLSPSVRITVFDVLQTSVQANMESDNLCASKIESFRSQDVVALEVSGLPRGETSSSAQVCRDCRAAARRYSRRFASRPPSRAHRPLMMMMVAVAAVCATVALLYKTGPMLDVMYSLKWEGIMYGPV